MYSNFKKKVAVPVSTAPRTTRKGGREEGRRRYMRLHTRRHDDGNNTETPRTAATIETSTGTRHVFHNFLKNKFLPFLLYE
jgi:hypothetical protein